ncbi:MAG: right-handed parallel beta-helix repeat-containing protein [Planctomycetota bacterium]
MVDELFGYPLLTSFLNWPVDHQTDGQHKFASDPDFNSFHAKNLKGYGGSSGKAVIFAEQYSGGDIGAKVNAAILDGAQHIIISTVSELTTTITLTNDMTLEFLPGARIYSTTDIPIIDAAAAHRTKIINPRLTGSNTAGYTTNRGITFAGTTLRPMVVGGKIEQCYRGIQEFGSDGVMIGTLIDACKVEGFRSYAALSRPTFIGVKSTGNGYSGFFVYGSTYGLFLNCVAMTNVRNGFHLYTCGNLRLIGCIAIDNSTAGANSYDGFHLEAVSVRNQLISCVGQKVSSALQRYGFQIVAGCSKNEIRGGIWYPNQTAS